jgi:cysteine-rich repeat protein
VLAALVAAAMSVLSACSAVPCGDGRLDVATEQCDDSNRRSGDGCSDACTLERRNPDCRGIEGARGDALGIELVAEGLYSPTALASPPGDARLFVLEQNGRVRIIEEGVLVERPFLDLTERITDEGNEQGLLGIAFHPDYARNGRFFLNFTDQLGDTVVARYQVSDDPALADPASETVLLTVEQPYANPNGGHVVFDDAGMLWVGMGDGGARADMLEAAQDDGQLLGKLLRLDVDVEGPPYWRAPRDNPHPDAPGPLALVWAKGVRNPWRFSFDRATGDLYVADVGQNKLEEIDFVPASSGGGENYGWDLFEGTQCFEPDPAPECPPASGFVMPVHEYGRDVGCSITGGFVYRGCAMPDLRGAYFYSDFCTGFVKTLRIEDGEAAEHRDRTAELVAAGFIVGFTTSFGEDARGELYLLNRDGRVWRFVPGSADATAPAGRSPTEGASPAERAPAGGALPADRVSPARGASPKHGAWPSEAVDRSAPAG